MLRNAAAIVLLASFARADYVVQAETANFTADLISPNGTRTPVEGTIETIQVMNVVPVALADQDPGMNIQVVVSPLKSSSNVGPESEYPEYGSAGSDLSHPDFDQYPSTALLDLPAPSPVPPPPLNVQSTKPISPSHSRIQPKSPNNPDLLAPSPVPPLPLNVQSTKPISPSHSRIQPKSPINPNEMTGPRVPPQKPAAASGKGSETGDEMDYTTLSTWPVDVEKAAAESPVNSKPAASANPWTNFSSPSQFDTLLNSSQNASSAMPNLVSLPPAAPLPFGQPNGFAGQQPFSFPFFNASSRGQLLNRSENATNPLPNLFGVNQPTSNLGQLNRNPFAAPKSNWTKTQKANPFAAPNFNLFGTSNISKSNSFETKNSSKSAAEKTNPFGVPNTNRLGALNANPFGAANANQIRMSNPNPFEMPNGDLFGALNGNLFGAQNANLFGVPNNNLFGVKSAGKGPQPDDVFSAPPEAKASTVNSTVVAANSSTSNASAQEESMLNQMLDLIGLGQSDDAIVYVDDESTEEPNGTNIEPVDMDSANSGTSDLSPTMYWNDVRVKPNGSAKPAAWPLSSQQQGPLTGFPPGPWSQKATPTNPWLRLFNMSRTPTANTANFSFAQFGGRPWRSSSAGNASVFSDAPNLDGGTVLQNLTFTPSSDGGQPAAANAFVGLLNGSSVNVSDLLADAMNSAENTTTFEVDYEVDLIAESPPMPVHPAKSKSKQSQPAKTTTESPDNFGDIIYDMANANAYDYGLPAVPVSGSSQSEGNGSSTTPGSTTTPPPSHGVAVDASWTVVWCAVAVTLVGQKIWM